MLVILGLLSGGILAGQSLIRAAEIRAVSAEYSRYNTAIMTFRDKYFSIPGDFRDATRFWGFAGTTAAPGCVSNSGVTAVSTNGACDGNGDGRILITAAANTTSDSFQLWRHLALAGLIEGNYSGLSGASSTGAQSVFASNTPASRLGNAGWSMNYINGGGTNLFYQINYGNTFYFGAATASNLSSGAVLKPEEAWNIDTKMDDGKPGRGKIIARNILACTGDGNMTNYDANYLLTSSDIACALHFANTF